MRIKSFFLLFSALMLQFSYAQLKIISGESSEVASSELGTDAYVKTTDFDALIGTKTALLVNGTNLFDKAAIFSGKYVQTNGNLSVDAAYDYSDYIPVSEGQQYKFNKKQRFVTYYNSSKVVVSGGLENVNAFTVPAGTAFIIHSLFHADIDTLMLVKGSTLPSSYIPYKKVVSPENLEIYSSQIIKDVDPTPDTFKLFLPKEVCVAVGRTIELYNSQVSWCGNINDYHFLWSGVGRSMKRKWTLTGTTIGNNVLTLTVYNKNNVVVASKTTTVKVVSAAITTPFSLCCIGDSLTNSKLWQPELQSLSGNAISLVGSRWGNGTIESPIKHEGRSGATSAYYLGNNSYTFENKGVNGNDGRTSNLNPFWNPKTSDVDFAYYKSNYNQNPDKLLIWLGTNGITVDPTTNATNIKVFIDKIRATGGSKIPIFVVHTLFRGNQDGIGMQTGSDGYVANKAYKLEEDLKVFNLQEKILSDLSAYPNLYLVPVSTCHDSEYNFGAVPTPVNPRASQLEYLPSQATHPQAQGYLQIADVIFSSLAAHQ